MSDKDDKYCEHSGARLPLTPFIERVFKLDGMCAVNLSEPCAGDLERVYKAYIKKCKDYADLEKRGIELATRLEELEWKYKELCK